MATTQQLEQIRKVVTSLVREQPRLSGFFDAMTHELALVEISLEHIAKSVNPEGQAEISRLIQSILDLTVTIDEAVNDPAATFH
jgi:hypothetical protein